MTQLTEQSGRWLELVRNGLVMAYFALRYYGGDVIAVDVMAVHVTSLDRK